MLLLQNIMGEQDFDQSFSSKKTIHHTRTKWCSCNLLLHESSCQDSGGNYPWHNQICWKKSSSLFKRPTWISPSSSYNTWSRPSKAWQMDNTRPRGAVLSFQLDINWGAQLTRSISTNNRKADGWILEGSRCSSSLKWISRRRKLRGNSKWKPPELMWGGNGTKVQVWKCCSTPTKGNRKENRRGKPAQEKGNRERQVPAHILVQLQVVMLSYWLTAVNVFWNWFKTHNSRFKNIQRQSKCMLMNQTASNSKVEGH